jgi:hypothetical protein
VTLEESRCRMEVRTIDLHSIFGLEVLVSYSIPLTHARSLAAMGSRMIHQLVVRQRAGGPTAVLEPYIVDE